MYIFENIKCNVSKAALLYPMRKNTLSHTEISAEKYILPHSSRTNTFSKSELVLENDVLSNISIISALNSFVSVVVKTVIHF